MKQRKGRGEIYPRKNFPRKMRRKKDIILRMVRRVKNYEKIMGFRMGNV